MRIPKRTCTQCGAYLLGPFCVCQSEQWKPLPNTDFIPDLDGIDPAGDYEQDERRKRNNDTD